MAKLKRESWANSVTGFPKQLTTFCRRAELWMALEQFEKLGKLLVDLVEDETQLEDDLMIERFALWSIMNATSCRRFIVVVPVKNLEWENKYQHLSFMEFDEYKSIFFNLKK
jgi:hypothetical protein